jgi:hypothetical protein
MIRVATDDTRRPLLPNTLSTISYIVIFQKADDAAEFDLYSTYDTMERAYRGAIRVARQFFPLAEAPTDAYSEDECTDEDYSLYEPSLTCNGFPLMSLSDCMEWKGRSMFVLRTKKSVPSEHGGYIPVASVVIFKLMDRGRDVPVRWDELGVVRPSS